MRLRCRRRPDLLHEAQEVWLTTLLDDLAVGNAVKIHSLDGDRFPGGGNPEKIALVRSPHSEARCNASISGSELVLFDSRLFQRPLDVGEAAAHHTDDGEVAGEAPHGLISVRDMEDRAVGDQLISQRLIGRIDEFDKAPHECVGDSGQDNLR